MPGCARSPGCPTPVERLRRGQPAPEDRGGRIWRRLHAPGTSPFHWEIELRRGVRRRARRLRRHPRQPPWVSYVGGLRKFLSPPTCATPTRPRARRSAATRTCRACSSTAPPASSRPRRAASGWCSPRRCRTSVAMQPSRRAHDALCACDLELPDFGRRRALWRVSSSRAMGLVSLHAAPRLLAARSRRPAPGRLQREDLDRETAALLDAIGAPFRLPPQLFGERGFQEHACRPAPAAEARPSPRRSVPHRGARGRRTSSPFLRRAPQLYCDPRSLRRPTSAPSPSWRRP